MVCSAFSASSYQTPKGSDAKCQSRIKAAIPTISDKMNTDGKWKADLTGLILRPANGVADELSNVKRNSSCFFLTPQSNTRAETRHTPTLTVYKRQVLNIGRS